jgi:hypothetical protein
MTLYRAIELPSDEPVQYVGCYVLNWGHAPEPTVGFVPVDEDAVAELAGALEVLIEEIDACQTEEDLVVLSRGYAVKQARAALAKAQGTERSE